MKHSSNIITQLVSVLSLAFALIACEVPSTTDETTTDAAENGEAVSEDQASEAQSSSSEQAQADAQAASSITVNSSSNSSSSATPSVQTGTFTIKTTKAIVAVNSGGGVSAYDQANGLGTVGDTNSESKRIIVTFPIAALAGKTVSNAKLKLYYESKTNTNVIADLGPMIFLKLAGNAYLSSYHYSAIGTYQRNIASTDSALNSYYRYQEIALDIQDQLKASINASDSYITFRVQMNSENGNGNNAVNFYLNYSSVVLENYIPRISGSWSE